MTPRSRKWLLVAHIVVSVGWLGAILPYLAIAAAGFTSQSSQQVRAAFAAMSFLGWNILVPLSVAALVTGLVQSLATRWGFTRYWWILAKLALTIASVAILFRHMQLVAHIAADTAIDSASIARLRFEFLLHPTGGLIVLLVITVLSVFKPWGTTPFAFRKTISAADVLSRIRMRIAALHAAVWSDARPGLMKMIGIHAAVVGFLLIVILHIALRHVRIH